MAFAPWLGWLRSPASVEVGAGSAAGIVLFAVAAGLLARSAVGFCPR